jgi:putative PIN family toxin of toxin-antitoxin system
MPGRRHGVIIDTNLLISFLIYRDYSKLDRILSHKKIALLCSQKLMDEFIEVAHCPKFKRYFSISNIQELVLQISTRAEFIEVTTNLEICSDPKDKFLLALAKDGKATHLLTGDKELLSLMKYSRVEHITTTEYLGRI